MNKRLTLVIATAICACNLFAQTLYDAMGPVPIAVCKVAPLPKAQAEAKAQLEKEKARKLIKQGMSIPAVDAKVLASKNKYVTNGNGVYRLTLDPKGVTVKLPVYTIKNTSHGQEGVKSGNEKFNVKKDRISSAVISGGQYIQIVNRNDKKCNMDEFIFEADNKAVKMNGNKIELQVPVLHIAVGMYPSDYKITCIHEPSAAKYIFDLHMDWREEISCSGADGAYSFDVFPSDTFPDLALMCNLNSKELEVVRLPFTFAADGYAGSDGRRGVNGANGKNESEYTDSDGKKHYIKGTCGKPGEDGHPGSDGTDGGTFLFCVSDALLNSFGLEAVSATVDGGKGGKGGAGGKGGKHGEGSGCSGKAADGKTGANGKDGKRGDFLYLITDVNEFYYSIP